jgi:2-oxoglutarate ferredoxin oxidoreductase subunit beta
MKNVYKKPESMTSATTIYCPGCHHGIAHRLIAEVIDELGIADRTIGIAPVGCAALAYDYFDIDFSETPHGRAPAVATGLKLTQPDRVVFTYQGDGDLASIGAAEILHLANRGFNITTIFINNAIYGMTGGQMAPTTLEGQKTTTTPFGRDLKVHGHPMKVSEILTNAAGVAYIARGAVYDPKHVMETKKMIKKAFQNQIDGKGFSMVEILSTCPTNWGLSPLDAVEWLKKNMEPFYPLGVKKDIDQEQ